MTEPFFGLLLCCYIFQTVHTSCTEGPQPLLEWFEVNGTYYGVQDTHVNFTVAKCICEKQPGATRLTILSEQEDFKALTPIIIKLQISKEFWLDAVRTSGSVNYTWGNGCILPLSDDRWNTYEPSQSETAVSMVVYPSSLFFFGNDPTGRFLPLCQSYSPIYELGVINSFSITWLVFEDEHSSQIFGFSNQVADLETGRQICSSYGSEFALASLSTKFEQVASYIRQNRASTDEFWVDASRSGNASFRWADGELVNTTYFQSSEPDSVDTVIRLVTWNGITLLAGIDVVENKFFMCSKGNKEDASSISDNTGKLNQRCNYFTTESTQVTTMASTEITTEISTEVTTEVSTMASTEMITDSSRMASTEVTTEVSTMASTEITTDSSRMASTEVTKEASTIASTEITTDSSTMASKELTTEASTMASTEVTTGASTEVTTDSSTMASTEITTDSSTMASTEVTTEASTEVTTEASTIASTELTTDPSTMASTEETTETPTMASIGITTEASTDITTKVSAMASSEKTTEASSIASAEIAAEASVETTTVASTMSSLEVTTETSTEITAETFAIASIEITTEVSTMAPTELTTEISPKITTESSTKMTTESSTKITTESSTKITIEALTITSTEITTETSTELTTETSTELTINASTDITEESKMASTEITKESKMASTEITEESKMASTEVKAEPSAEITIVASTMSSTEVTTETSTEITAKASTLASTTLSLPSASTMTSLSPQLGQSTSARAISSRATIRSNTVKPMRNISTIAPPITVTNSSITPGSVKDRVTPSAASVDSGHIYRPRLSVCTCKAVSSLPQHTWPDVWQTIILTRENLTLSKVNLSATRRRKSSVQDTRPSAMAAGWLGVGIIIFMAIFIIVPDLCSIVQVLQGQPTVKYPRRPGWLGW